MVAQSGAGINYVYQRPHRVLMWFSRILTIALISFTAIYSVVLFSDTTIEDILFYLLPAFTLAFIMEIVWKHEKLGGILFVLISFSFLLLYRVYVSFALFVLLLMTGVLYLIDDYRVHNS